MSIVDTGTDDLAPPDWGFVLFLSALIGLFLGTGLWGSIVGIARDLGRDSTRFSTEAWYFGCWAVVTLAVLPFQLRSDRRRREREAIERKEEDKRRAALKQSIRDHAAVIAHRRASGRACLACHASGEVSCESCRGSRNQRCPACHGVGCDRCAFGEVTCTRCGGTGEVRCLRCGGAGLER
jgi:hypothetical protein